jgi:alpha-1,3-rhamnosyl/mannosyltransferase
LPNRFLLHVGDIHPRRNIPVIESVAQELNLPLVLVGKLLKGAERSQKPQFLFTGVSQAKLVGIYNAATVLVYPSCYEGFGLPILEAMACGLPVVAADRASIPEVCGDAAILVEPRADSLLEGISRVLDSRDEYVARGLERVRNFSWEKTSQETVNVYEELL